MKSAKKRDLENPRKNKYTKSMNTIPKCFRKEKLISPRKLFPQIQMQCLFNPNQF